MMKKLLFSLLLISTTLSVFANGSSELKTDEPYTVTMVIQGYQPKNEEKIENKINEVLESELNTKLDLVFLPWGSAAQQIQLMLASGEKLDFFADGINSTISKMNNGQLVDLTALIDKYGTNIKRIYGELAIEACSQNGFTFGIPTQIERGSVPSVYLRKDIVDKYNLDLSVVNEPKDLEKLFIELKNKGCDLDLLYSSTVNDKPLEKLAGYDTLGDGHIVLMDQTRNKSLEVLYATDWYRENAEMFYDWYNKGYMNQDAAMTSENWRDVFKAGKLFSMIFLYHPATKVEFETATGYEFEIIQFRDKPVKNSIAYNNVTICLAQNSENPEKAMQTLDYIYGSKEIMNFLNWGIEGEDYVFVDRDKDIISYPEGLSMDTVEYSLNLGWELPNQFISHLWVGSDPDQWKNMEAWNDSADISNALGFVFNSTGYETEIAAISSVVNEYNGAISGGIIDPSVYIPKFLDALDDAGI